MLAPIFPMTYLPCSKLLLSLSLQNRHLRLASPHGEGLTVLGFLQRRCGLFGRPKACKGVCILHATPRALGVKHVEGHGQCCRDEAHPQGRPPTPVAKSPAAKHKCIIGSLSSTRTLAA